MNLSPRERRLVILIGGILFLLANLLLLSSVRKSFAKTNVEITSKREELARLDAILAEGENWQEREAWITRHQPVLENREQAGVTLLEEVRQVARASDVLLEKPSLGGIVAEAGYQSVSVEVETRSSWQALITLLHSLQRPENFIVFESVHLQVDPKDATQMQGRLKIARWYAP
ncbi:MAG TPA: GspMb/PilO family protein [Chthoniobacteraceae bacterium]|nr:GspMb/PilO family protein [Chthoniobacteraceae bacterium]